MVNDRRARFEEVYNSYSGLILAYAVRRTSDVQDAADVVAETFTVAWRRLEDIPPGDQARPWLYGVARRILANHHRGIRRRQSLYEQLITAVAASFVNAAAEVGGPDRERIAEALGKLDDSDRELLTLVGWDGLSHDDIAAILGCSNATVRVRLHRARKRFARHLNPPGVQLVALTGHGTTRGAPALPDLEEA